MKFFPLLVCTCFLFGIFSPCLGNSLDDFFSQYHINPAGIRQLRAGNFQEARKALEQDTAYSDTGFHYFKLALSYSGENDIGKALFYLRRALAADSSLAPFVYTKIGEIERNQERYINSLASYRSAVDTIIPPRYRQYIYSQMIEIASIISDSIGKINWLDEIVGIQAVDKGDPSKDFRAFVADSQWQKIDSMLTEYLDTSIYSKEQCGICSSLTDTKLPDTLLSTEKLYRLSKVANKCGFYSASSDFLHKAIDQADFLDIIEEKDYIFFRAELNYNLTNYRNAIKWFDTYESKFGPTPRLVYLVARSYRSLGQGASASAWYDKHVRLYPHHYKSHDILWYRAWQREDSGNTGGARSFYKRIFNEHKGRKLSDDAYFRYALTFYKDAVESKKSQDYQNALNSFTDFTRRYGKSQLHRAAQYWRAKCFLALNQRKKARDICSELSSSYPTDYYAYRGRELLRSTGDSSAGLHLDTIYDVQKTVSWLDSISRHAPQLSKNDSAKLYIGRKLIALGMTHIAEFYLEPLEMSYPQNLLLQFELASLYLMFDEPTLSYRVARRFEWRFAPQHKQSMPLPVYSLLYPNSFRTIIEPFADQNEVCPNLISAIMRQESIFDPQIVSPVGAVGLMQIMPYTGKDIALELESEFSVDTLYNAATNIRFGTYYISKLLRQFENDFILAIASYNAGPHNVRKWHKINKNDEFDMFVEDIGFSETRLYVKKVLANYWTYQRLSEIQRAFLARDFQPLPN